jgi:phosphonoacetaldehyde hydrolase
MRFPIRAVIFDWAGTTVDHGSLAPVRAVVELFAGAGIPITVAEARGPMGRAKHDHIATVLALPRVAAAWRAMLGRPATDADVERLYRDFLPRQRAVLAEHSAVIGGVPEAVADCRRRGLAIGGTTGYTRELLDVVEPLARAGGYAPDVSLCADDVPAGRPAPWMIFRACERLGVYPPAEVLVVDDTPVGIAAGRNAGARTLAVSRTGNALGLSAAEVAALPPAELADRLAAIEREFRAAGAEFVIESVADLPRLLDTAFATGPGAGAVPAPPPR